MNYQNTATSSPVISNLVNSKNRHQFHLVKNQKAPEIQGESNEQASSNLSVVVEECQHEFEFVPSPVELGFAQRCLHCGEVKLVERSEQLSELVAWLNHQVEEFEQLAHKAIDKSKQAYYLDCANNKQQLIERVNQFKEKAIELEKEKKEKVIEVKTICDLHDSVPPEVVSENEVVTKDDEKDRAEDIVIDPQFLTLIPPLSQDEKQQLERNLIEYGCRDALVVWNNILLDGHNRFELCKKHKIDFKLHRIDLPDRNAAHDWIIMNQLGRRNLSDDWMSNLRGKIYCSRKEGRGGNHGNQYTHNKVGVSNLAIGQNGTKPNSTSMAMGQESPSKSEAKNTAEEIGKEFGVAGRTIKRDGKYANAIDQLCYNFGQHWRPIIIDSKLTRTQVIELAKYVEEDEYYIEIEAVLNDIEHEDDFKENYRIFKNKINPPLFIVGQLVKIKFSNLEGLSEEQRLSNSQYALISEKLEHSYLVQLLGEKELLVKAEDINPVEYASYTVNFRSDEFSRLSQQFDSPLQLEAALKSKLFD